MSSTKVNCTGVQEETAFQLCWFGNVLELLLNILHYGLLSGKAQFKNTFCSDYVISQVFTEGVST